MTIVYTGRALKFLLNTKKAAAPRSAAASNHPDPVCVIQAATEIHVGSEELEAQLEGVLEEMTVENVECVQDEEAFDSKWDFVLEAADLPASVPSEVIFLHWSMTTS